MIGRVQSCSCCHVRASASARITQGRRIKEYEALNDQILAMLPEIAEVSGASPDSPQCESFRVRDLDSVRFLTTVTKTDLCIQVMHTGLFFFLTMVTNNGHSMVMVTMP
jgi:hypothetical protein